MGNSYCNFTTRGPARDEVVRFLNKHARSAYVSPTVDANTVVYERLSDRLEEGEIESVGVLLSKDLACPVLALAVFDDSELSAGLYESGQLVAECYSRGRNHRGARAICRAFGHPWRTPFVWLLFQMPFVHFEHFRHYGLAKLLGIPTWCVACGYRYISNHEFPPGLDAESLLQTGRGT